MIRNLEPDSDSYRFYSEKGNSGPGKWSGLGDAPGFVHGFAPDPNAKRFHMTRLLATILLAALSSPASAYLECQNQQTNDSVVWYQGQQFTGLPNYQIGSGYATCWAEGTELSYLKQDFPGLRWAPGRTVLWTGDDADFILANLPLAQQR